MRSTANVGEKKVDFVCGCCVVELQWSDNRSFVLLSRKDLREAAELERVSTRKERPIHNSCDPRPLAVLKMAELA